MTNRTHRLCAALAAIAVPLAAPLAASGQPLEVELSGLRNNVGVIHVCLWAAEDDAFPQCLEGTGIQRVTAPAADGVVVFEDVADGVYAVTMFHDEVESGAPETNFFGLPTSGLGMSNNPSIGPTQPPRFDRAAFSTTDTRRIEIDVRYLF